MLICTQIGLYGCTVFKNIVFEVVLDNQIKLLMADGRAFVEIRTEEFIHGRTQVDGMGGFEQNQISGGCSSF